MELFGVFQCGFCGQENETFVDLSAGQHQSYVEDCQTCCRPNVLSVTLWETEEDQWEVTINAELES